VWWNDIMTVSTPGSVANLNFLFTVNGTLAPSGNGSASALLVAEDCAATETLCTGGPPATPRHITTAPISGNGLVTLSLQPWLLKQPFEYEIILAVSPSALPKREWFNRQRWLRVV
jgi:hypothetical protein